MTTLACACRGCMVCGGRCPNLVRRGYCDACGPERERTKRQQLKPETEQRKKLYDSPRWRGTRKLVLYEEPWCPGWGVERCGAKTTEVDHIVPRADGGDEWARTNLQGLCKPCHSRKTAYENRLGRTLRADG